MRTANFTVTPRERFNSNNMNTATVREYAAMSYNC
jgi:hypothetical protein